MADQHGHGNMVDMKKPLKRRETKIRASYPETEKYPWGLRINLDRDSMAKLGKQADQIVVGGKVYIYAEAVVLSIDASESMERDSKGGVSSSMQIQKMEIYPPEKKKEAGSYYKDNSLSAIKKRVKKF